MSIDIKNFNLRFNCSIERKRKNRLQNFRTTLINNLNPVVLFIFLTTCDNCNYHHYYICASFIFYRKMSILFKYFFIWQISRVCLMAAFKRIAHNLSDERVSFRQLFAFRLNGSLPESCVCWTWIYRFTYMTVRR